MSTGHPKKPPGVKKRQALRVPTITLATPSLLAPASTNSNLSRTKGMAVSIGTFPNQLAPLHHATAPSPYPSLDGVFTPRVSQTKQDVRDIGLQFKKGYFVPASYRRTLVEKATSEDWVPFCVTLLSIDGLGPMFSEKEEDIKVEYEVRLHLYDVTYKMFFGRSWVGPRQSTKRGPANTSRLSYNVPVYFHTSLADQNIVLVVEVVRVTTSRGGEVQLMACGWGILRLFHQGDFSDTSHSTPAPVKRLDLLHGSPRALFFVGDDIEGNKKLTVISDCQVCYTIRTHRYMDKIMHLVPENVLLSGHERVPGVAVVDPKEGGDSLRRPRPLKRVSASINNISIVVYPTFDEFEEELCQQLNSDRLAMEQVQSDKCNVVVLERRLQIGVHNGWGYVGKPQVILLDTADSLTRGHSRGSMKRSKGRPLSTSGSSESLGSALLVKNRITLSQLVEDPAVVIVFLLEYIVSLPASTQDRKSAMSINRAQTQTIALRWAAWTPTFKESTCEVAAQLQGGALPNPDNIMVYRNHSAALSDREMSRLAAGKIQFIFNVKKEGSSRPVSPQSTQPSEPPRHSSMLDVVSDQKGNRRSVVSPVSPSSLTDQASLPDEAPPGLASRPPLPRGLRLPESGAPSHQVGVQPFMQHPGDSQHLLTPQYATTVHSSPHSFPMEIKHLEVGVPGGTTVPGDLEELPFTPVHAPIMPVGPYVTSARGLSRASFAHLSQAGFPELRDRNGEVAEVVDPSDQVTLNLQKESSDVLQCNEIVVQLLAFSRVLQFQQSAVPTSPRTVFFTFQFYRYPPVTTERLLLGNVEGSLTSDSQSLPCVLRKMEHDEAKSQEIPGWMVRYNVDPGFLKPGESQLFVKYLHQQTLHLDVWDGDSLLLIGSCAVELKHLLRSGRESVQVSHELDVITTEYGEDTHAMTGDLARSGSVRPVGVKAILKGHLHLRLANIGHSVDRNVVKAATMHPRDAKVVVQEDNSGAFLGGSVNLGARPSGLGLANLKQKRSYIASHMAETDRELASALLSSRAGQPESASQAATREGDYKKQRKLARMEAIRQAQAEDTLRKGANQSLLLKKEETLHRTRDLKTIELYRDRIKKDGILSMLQTAITTEHTIHPSFGDAEFWEYILRNPYNVQHTISIQWDDPELSIITDPREWRHFKQLFETYTAVEENMFSELSKESPNGSGLQLFLRPKETVNIPFKYQSFKASHSVPPQGPQMASGPYLKIQALPEEKKVDLALESKKIKIYFRTQDNKPIAILSLNVEPQPHVINQTFRFHHPEQSFLKKSIRLPPFHSVSGVQHGVGALGQLFVKCSDGNVICETKKVSAGEPQDVFLKVACGLSPSVKKMFILIYSTPYLSKPLQTWQFYIHSLQRVDVSCVEGQTSRQSLILRGTRASRLVQCFSSHPNEMQIMPSEPFMLLANAVHEIHVGVRPISVGSKFMYINVVDKEYHQLVRSWLVCVQCRQPVISKAFELQLPVGGGKGSNKRITYTNPYQQSKEFIIRCNRDDLLQFKEAKVQIGGSETYSLGLRFTPCQQAGSAEILIFINDDRDNNEETFLIRAIYS
ncbi:nephrocystin-4-like isoform X2 [Acanthaster planci]|uniref:Nephrocystin-4-like isoform X2 n=1 Tax=Acanthaster planci TaxID=133434 RepID=A0A8B7XXB2_ACAPL|nr:nephrocystin-4-like isoform X2 [Acanthaster planci]